jgi:hypothetical protein
MRKTWRRMITTQLRTMRMMGSRMGRRTRMRRQAQGLGSLILWLQGVC